MCDTIVATGPATADGVTLFAKNSDRPPNEAHHVIIVPAKDHPQGAMVKCTYVEIPQVKHTYAVLLAKPFWIWGAEMGMNEHGVAIGNEALFTKVPYDKQPGLIGMDFLRLALERAATAEDALSIIIDLLEQYGQSGNCTLKGERYYHNSFLIADPHTAWVLETAGKQWAAKQVRGLYAISNAITIGREWDKASTDLVAHAVRQKWCTNEADFDFARCYSDFIYTTFAAGRYRRHCTLNVLSPRQGQITVATMIAALRSHGDDPTWRPDRGLTGSTPCMHASFGPVRVSQTTGSLVCHLHPRHPTCFVTATAAPCTSIFKPLWLDIPFPLREPSPSDTYNAACLFWRHELLHRATLRDYTTFLAAYQEERDALEESLIAHALAAADQGVAERSTIVMQAFTEAEAAEARWLERVRNLKPQRRRGWLHQQAWQQFDQAAHMPSI